MALVKLDGTVGEGGGQLVRIAIGLSALTGTPVRIDNVRGNRPGKRGGNKAGGGMRFCLICYTYSSECICANSPCRSQSSACFFYRVAH